jgi:hypothetical protein
MPDKAGQAFHAVDNQLSFAIKMSLRKLIASRG